MEDLARLQVLSAKCALQVNITVETDQEALPAGFPRHMYPPSARIAALRQIRMAGITAAGGVSPLLPLDDPRGFAQALEHACNRVILDHFVIDDGSPGGLRTRRSGFARRLIPAGCERWTHREALREVEAIFRQVFGDPGRVGCSREGFNATPKCPFTTECAENAEDGEGRSDVRAFGGSVVHKVPFTTEPTEGHAFGQGPKGRNVH